MLKHRFWFGICYGKQAEVTKYTRMQKWIWSYRIVKLDYKYFNHQDLFLLFIFFFLGWWDWRSDLLCWRGLRNRCLHRYQTSDQGVYSSLLLSNIQFLCEVLFLDMHAVLFFFVFTAEQKKPSGDGEDCLSCVTAEETVICLLIFQSN